MAALDFPSSPTNGQTYTANGTTWIYDSTLTKWAKTPLGYPDFANATQAQMEAGTDDSAYVTALKAKFSSTAIKAFGTQVTDAAASAATYNVTSITDNGAGDNDFTFTNAFANTNYGGASTTWQSASDRSPDVNPTTTSICEVQTHNDAGSQSASSGHVNFFGDLA